MYILMSLILLTQHPHAPQPKQGLGGNHKRPPNIRPIAPLHKGRFHQKNYHQAHGHRFRHGWYYNGWQHRHWSYHYWDHRYGCYLFLDPYVKTYYYWCAPHYRFYPINYVPFNTYVFPYVVNPPPPAVPPPSLDD